MGLAEKALQVTDRMEIAQMGQASIVISLKKD